MSERKLNYPMPFRIVSRIWPNICNNTSADIELISRQLFDKFQYDPIVEGLEQLPASSRFVLAANHYQRRGLWILHAAGVLTRLMVLRYGLPNPPVRWIVTANWPPIKVGAWTVASPGDVLLPRVAAAFSCYPVSFSGSNPAFTARSIRRILREIPEGNRPLGLFPEGVLGTADRMTDPLPGVDRFLTHLAKRGVPVVPCGISEHGRFVIRFGNLIETSEVLRTRDAAEMVMGRVRELVGKVRTLPEILGS